MIFLGLCSPQGQDICKNGGSCFVDENGSARCVCAKGFEGIFCEISTVNAINSIPIEKYILNFILKPKMWNVKQFSEIL